MYNNDRILAQAECSPKVAGGALGAWIIAAFIMLPGIWGAAQINDWILLVIFAILAAIPALIGLVVQLIFISGTKKTALVATDRCLYYSNKDSRRYSSELMPLPYEYIMNIRVIPEGMSRMNGETLILQLPDRPLVFHNITNGPQIVMAIRGKVEEIKGPMPPYGYGAMMPMYPPMGYFPQPMYGQGYQPVQPVQQGYQPPVQHSYEPVRPEDRQPMQTIRPDSPKPETPEQAKPVEGFELPEDK